MRMPRIAALLAMLLLSPMSAAAAEYHQQIEQFITTLKAGKTNEAITALYSTNPWMARSADQVQNLKSQMASLDKLVGSLKAYEKIQEIPIGTRYVHVTYLVLYERQPIRFEFKFYRPGNAWMIYGFAYDDKLDDNVQDTAHQSLVKQ